MLRNYTAKSKCPICGRYKSAYKDKCHGFVTTDGRYAYCSREEGLEGQRRTKTHYGKTLYRHTISGYQPLCKEHTTKTPISPSAIEIVEQPKETRVASSTTASFATVGDELDEIIRQRQESDQWPYKS